MLQRMEMKGERKPKSNRGKLTRENAVGKSNVEPKLKVWRDDEIWNSPALTLHPGTRIVGSSAKHSSFSYRNLFWKFLQSCEPEGMSSPELNKMKLQQKEPTF